MPTPRTYLDHAASTPLDPRVMRAMQPYFLAKYGNPGSLHGFGQEAIAAVDAARASVASVIGATFREIIFTGSATEANNLALRGAVRAWNAAPGHEGQRPRVVVSAVEHESVLETAQALAREEGAEVVIVPVDREGAVDAAAVAEAARPGTAVVSVMYVNNETGTVQPVAAIAQALRAARGRDRWPLFHTDAAQAFPYLSCDVAALGADMMTLSGHKMCGPKGVGALFIKEGAREAAMVVPLITGGGQEYGLRSGTENVPLIAGFARAAELAAAARGKEAKRLASLRQYAITGIKKTLRNAEVNGPRAGEGLSVSPHILNIYIPGVLADDAVMRLDFAGIAVSSGSACRARAAVPSHVLRAMGCDEARARGSIRLSFGRTTGKKDIDRALAAMKLFPKIGRNR